MKQARDLPLPAAWVVLIVAIGAAFAPVLTCGFTSWDDYQTVARNPRLDPPTTRALVQFWTSPRMDLYVPLTYSVWAGVARAARLPVARDGSTLDPLPFHALNLLLHVLAAGAVMLVLRELLASNLAALIGALFFALHPVQVESVAWVSGTKDVLSGLLSFLAVWQYLRLTRPDRADGAPTKLSRSAWWGLYLLAMVTFVLAMLAKPAALVVPGVVIVLDWLVVGRRLSRVWRTIWPWVALAIPCAVTAWYFQRSPDSAASAPAVWLRPLIAADAVAFYLYKLVFPVRLGIDYGRLPQRVIAQGWAYYTWIIPAAITAASIVLWRRSRILAVAALVMGVALLPVLGLVPFDFQGYSTVADHYLYLAMLGPALLAGWAVMRCRSTAVLILAFIGLFSLGVRSFAQARNWRNSQTLFDHALEVNPRSFASYDSLAAGAIERGDWPAASGLARRAIACEPRYSRSYVTLARALTGAGQDAAAENALHRALRLRSDDPAAMANLSALLASQGRLQEAIPLARRAAQLEPDAVDVQLNLGKMYLAAEQLDLARRQFQAVLRLHPDNAEARELLRQFPGGIP